MTDNNVQHKRIPMEYQHIPFAWIVENNAVRRSIIPKRDYLLLYQLSSKEIYVSLNGEFHIVGTGYPRNDSELYLQMDGHWVRLSDYLYEHIEVEKLYCEIGNRALTQPKLYSYDYDRKNRPTQTTNTNRIVNSKISGRSEGDTLIFDLVIDDSKILLDNTTIKSNVLYLDRDVLECDIINPEKFIINIVINNSEQTLLQVVNNIGYDVIIYIVNTTVEMKNREVYGVSVSKKNDCIYVFNHGIRSLPTYWNPIYDV